MNIVIPLAGKDSRFEERKMFKAFTSVEGKPLIKFCIDGLSWPFEREDIKLIFIILKEHDEKYHVKRELLELYPNSKIIIQEELADGAACSVLFAKEFINNKEELVIYLADIYFKSNLKEDIGKNNEISGFIPTFKSNNDKYSYAKLDYDNFVIGVAEKKVISDNASTGFYYFKHGSDFVKYAERMINKNLRVNNLFYVCPVYNEFVEEGKKIKIIPSEFIFDLGDDKFIEKYVDS